MTKSTLFERLTVPTREPPAPGGQSGRERFEALCRIAEGRDELPGKFVAPGSEALH